VAAELMGGLGGFFPPLVMAVVKSATGGHALGFLLMAAAAACLMVLRGAGAPAAASV
jgi:NNP family nitrate/nitrite transporter-like MFS transporter